MELQPSSVLLSSLTPSGLAGLGSGLVPWLLSGAALALHQGFDATVLGVQIERQEISHLVLPAVVARAGFQEGLLDRASLRMAACITRPSKTIPPSCPASSIAVTEFAALGEIGIASMPRKDANSAISFMKDDLSALEFDITTDGILGQRGAKVPTAPFPGSEGGAIYPVYSERWVSTRFPAVFEDGAVSITDSRQDIVSLGGYSLALPAAEHLYADVPGSKAVTAKVMPDPILGERLALEIVPEANKEVTPATLAAYAAERDVSPLAIATDVQIGDRRKNSRFAGAS
jgi:hypothetical protein